jgi:hypothetical protein
MENTKIFDRPIAFHREFVSVAGITGAVMLSQAVYWSKRTEDKKGWFYKTRKEWEEETGLSRQEQETARKKLCKTGVLEEVRKGIPARLFFRVNYNKLYKSVWQADGDFPANKMGTFPPTIYTENTTENTNTKVLQKSEISEDSIGTFIITKKNKSKPDINKLSRYFLEKMKLPKEGISQKKSRQFWYILLKDMNNDPEKVKSLIDITSEDEWYQNNISSSRDLYYKRITILARTRKKKRRVVGHV